MQKQNKISVETLKKEQGFTGPMQVPENYFTGFSEKMLQRVQNIQANESLEDIKSIASSDFEVPQGYWEQSKKEIMARVVTGENRPIIKKINFVPAFIQIGIAASLGLLFMFNMPNKKAVPMDPSIESTEVQMQLSMDQMEKMDVSEEVLIEAIVKKEKGKKIKKEVYFEAPILEDMVAKELDINDIIDQL